MRCTNLITRSEMKHETMGLLSCSLRRSQLYLCIEETRSSLKGKINGERDHYRVSDVEAKCRRLVIMYVM